ncbi:MAG: tyrosine-protein phosphatase [Bacilli bacterium]
MKFLDFENMLNMRDCGGFETSDGYVIKYDTLIRSDAIKELKDCELQYLLDRNITTQIDLRTETVIENFPSFLKNNDKFHYYSFPIVEGSQITLSGNKTSDLYLKMVENKKNFKSIFKAIINADGGVIINCTAGKDRTGVVIALLFELLGVNEISIIDDYKVSASYIDSRIPNYRKSHPEFPISLGVSNEEDIKSFLESFHNKYESARNYLLLAGLTKNDIERLKAKFLTIK